MQTLRPVFKICPPLLCTTHFLEEDKGAAAVLISLEVRCNFYHNQRAFAQSIKQWSILVRRQHLQYNPLKIFFITDGRFFEYNEKVFRWHHQKDRCIVGFLYIHKHTLRSLNTTTSTYSRDSNKRYVTLINFLKFLI